jgi:two-component system chemotaxis sensor kinase CheA
MDMLKIYIEEANELLANLEVALLALENNADDKSYIEETFRIMHTLKGNSSMFGLNLVADFLHNLETIYDKVRAGEKSVTKDLLNYSLASLDHLKLIIHDTELADADNLKNHEELTAKIAALINTSGEAAVVKQPVKEEGKVITYHIYFAPASTIFNDGTNLLILLSELGAMGRIKAVPHFSAVATVEEFDPTSCITSWDIYLETAQETQLIRDVFVFVEENSEIVITALPGTNLLDAPEFAEAISANTFGEQRANTEEITAIAETLAAKAREAEEAHEAKIQTLEHTVKKIEGKEKNVSSIRVYSDKLDELMNLVSELVTTQASLTLFTENNRIPELETISENVEKLSRRLRDVAFGMTLVPINNMFSRFQRMVRDTSNQLGKEVEFVTLGGETELDKTIIETLTDPLMHIIRNSLDHGIEKAEDRLRKGKPREGKLLLRAYYSGVFVYIEISDDGKGIDPEMIRAKAISKGIIREDDVLSEKEIIDLIFYPGFSTAEQITEVSGRGVGMDVVKRNITSLKGSIIVNSKPNEGTSLTVKLPLTLSIIDGLLVVIDHVHYIIPLSVINKCYEVSNSEMISNFNGLLVLDNQQVPFINMRAEFGSECDSTAKSQMIVVHSEDRTVGLSVDTIIGEYQAVIKPVGKYYERQDFVSGATILGDGTIALVLDTNKIIDLHTQQIQFTEKI